MLAICWWVTLASIVLMVLVTAHAIWVRLRVVFLKQDLFKIRDELWDKAFALDELSNIHYRATRMMINQLIRVAPDWGLGTFLFLKRHQAEASRISEARKNSEHFEAASPELQRACTKAVEEACDVMMDYLFFKTLGGKWYLVFLGLFGRLSRTAKAVVPSKEAIISGVQILNEPSFQAAWRTMELEKSSA